jgi:hypothetical protein
MECQEVCLASERSKIISESQASIHLLSLTSREKVYDPLWVQVTFPVMIGITVLVSASVSPTIRVCGIIAATAYSMASDRVQKQVREKERAKNYSKFLVRNYYEIIDHASKAPNDQSVTRLLSEMKTKLDNDKINFINRLNRYGNHL